MHYNEERGIVSGPLKKLLPRGRTYTPAEEFHTYRTLRELVATKAAEQPNDVAFQYLKGRHKVITHTYGEFYRTIVYLATYLLKRGFRGRKIALVGENSYQWLLCFFAIVTSGNTAVLVSKDATPAEASTLIFQSQAEVVVTSAKYPYEAELLEQKSLKSKHFFNMKDMDEWEEKGRKFHEKGRGLYEKVELDPDAMCTIFFTSGTSGASKGVMLSHRNILSNANDAAKVYQPEGSTLAILPFTHAFGLNTGVLLIFHYGYPVFISNGLQSFMREMEIAKPNILFLVPLFLETFSNTIWRTAKKQGQARTLRLAMTASNTLRRVGLDRREKMFASIREKFGGNLKYIICGGAALDPRYIREFRTMGIDVMLGYGITECSPIISVNTALSGQRAPDESVGWTFPSVEVKIDEPDSTGRGEILVRGDNVMLGYFNDPISTADAFRDGWFCTGDLGRINKDGSITITGRKKNLIILSNGENLSPEEIETLLERIPEIGEVVVYTEDGLIVAEIFPAESEVERSDEELKKVIQARINEYNAEQPGFKRVNKVKIRKSEFEKTNTMKIKRYKVVEKSKKD
jgi:long-chain acyl-CoA synthetase